MKHRHFSNPFTRSETDQHHTPAEQSYSPTGRAVAAGNDPFVGQTDRMHRGGVHSDSHRTSEGRANKYPVTHVHSSNYNVPTIHDIEAGPSNCTTGIRVPLKRKRPDLSESCERGGPSSFYSAGSSSSSSHTPTEKPRNVPPHDNDSQRNVRRRPTLESEPSHPTTHLANNYTPVRPADHRRISPPDSSSRYVHGLGGPALREGHGHRYSHHAHGLHAPLENFSSRYSRRWSARGWRGSYRGGRPRIHVERSQPVLDVSEAHRETIMMLDRASFYVSSGNFSDEYRDLRLDIDSMSYEELLNLEERIGNVSTGLSEGSMSKCLKEKAYCSSDQNRAEVSCPICLEEYRKEDRVGTVEKCGHDYHVDCIKKWLLMKKVCPICKSECSNQEPTQG